MAESRILRCVIVGTGAIAGDHARSVTTHAAAELVGVTDLRLEAAEQFARRWGGPAVFGDLDEMLAAARPDVVMICTPPGAHLPQTLAAFAAGAHVVVEKPPARSLDELAQMQQAAADAGRHLVTVFQQRTGSAANTVKRLLDSGALGRPLLAQCQTLWFRDQGYFAVPWRAKWDTEGGGTSLGHGIHQLDLLAYLLGDWREVQARMWRLDRETQTEDVSTATVVFDSGALAQAVSSTVSPREASSIRIDTQRATITVDHLYGHGHENWRITPAPHVPTEESATWTLPDVEQRSDHALLVHAVFDAILAGEELPAIALAPERSFGLVGAMYASAAADGATVTRAEMTQHPTHRASFETPVTDLRPAPPSEE